MQAQLLFTACRLLGQQLQLDMMKKRLPMGTDISIYAELLTDEGWQATPPLSTNPWSRGVLEPTPALDIGRPRNLISVLAGRGTGVAARMACSAIPAISAPRGLPNDMNPLYREFFDDIYNFDDYWGKTWLWLREIQEFDWYGLQVSTQGYVDPELAYLFAGGEGGFPTGFPKDATLFHGLFRAPPEETVPVQWTSSLAEWVGCLDWFLRGLQELGPPDKVRLIYWFSS